MNLLFDLLLFAILLVSLNHILHFGVMIAMLTKYLVLLLFYSLKHKYVVGQHSNLLLCLVSLPAYLVQSNLKNTEKTDQANQEISKLVDQLKQELSFFKVDK